MAHVRNGQKPQPHRKPSKKCMIAYWTMGEWDRWSCGDIGRKGAKHLARRIQDAKALHICCKPIKNKCPNNFLSKLWIASLKFGSILCGDVSPWRRHGFITTYQKRNSSRSSRGEAGGSAPKKAKSMASTGKVMASVFWDAKGILLIDYLEKGKTIISKFYSKLFWPAGCQNSRGLAWRRKQSSFTRTTHLYTGNQWWWENGGIYDTIYSGILPILLIRHFYTFICTQTERNFFLGSTLHPMKKLRWLWMKIFTAFQALTSEKEYWCWRNARPSVLKSRKIM